MTGLAHYTPFPSIDFSHLHDRTFTWKAPSNSQNLEMEYMCSPVKLQMSTTLAAQIFGCSGSVRL